MRFEGVDVKIERDRVILKATRSKKEILNMLAGEFFTVSELGQMTLAEIYSQLLIRARSGAGRR